MGTTVQFNTRLDRDLKASGDAALSLIGLNPTQAVRALWEKAARRGEDLEQVAQLLAPATDQAPQAKAADVVQQGWALMDAAYESLGIDLAATSDFPDDDEMLEEALYERMVQRELA
ncbi:MAG: hypothetical protein IKF56_04565 [Eggerthellaceae bacterium]|nr:hypothetical protein [Eggerthellaceae bacterium]